MDPKAARDQLLGWVEQHDRWRREDSISLLPSENILSEDVLRMVGSDMASRYSLKINAVVHGFYMDNAYGGTRLSDEVETLGEKLACQVFDSRFATLKPIGAHIAGMMAILGLTEKKDLILTIDAEHGGYDGYMPEYMPGFTGRRVGFLPYDQARGTTDSVPAAEMIRARKPSLVIIGASFIPFPFEVAPLREACDDVGARLLYDGSHVLGLIAGGQFQRPLEEGCDLVLGSTHKSFFGPQGGIIATNDEQVHEAVTAKVTWYTMDNAHQNRIGGVAMALAELAQFGESYAKQVISNSQALGREIHEGGIKMRFPERSFSQSHQLVFDPADVPDPSEASKKLEPHGLIIDRTSRLGTAEITHLGAVESDMPTVARLLLDGLTGKDITSDVRELRSRLRLTYGF